ncbi:MAG: acylneuraminate cytidylyltransferase family protein [Halopseudomonas aestusnigri]
MRRLAIIPARGGSKRLPGKNIRSFCGKPMISYILETAEKSTLFDTIHVSTDCEEITRVVSDLGFPPDFPRPDKLADDHTPIMPVLKYVAEVYREKGQEFDQIWLLMACSPLVEPTDLVGAAKFSDIHNGEKAVISVAPYPVPVEWAFDLMDNGVLVPTQPGKFAIRSQDLGVKYYDTGSYVAFPSSHVFESCGAGSDTNFIGYVISKNKAVDIDDEEDWKLAEALFKH